MFHLTQLRYVVVELKIGRFQSGYLGQLGTYVAVVDDRVRDQALHAPTVGILLCTSRDEHVVRYPLSSAAAPLAVATYETLTPAQRAGLPDPAQLTAALAEVQRAETQHLQDQHPDDQDLDDGPQGWGVRDDVNGRSAIGWTRIGGHPAHRGRTRHATTGGRGRSDVAVGALTQTCAILAMRRAEESNVEEYPEPPEEEWDISEAHLLRRKVNLGTYGTNCQHEHAGVRCALLLRADPKQSDQLPDIITNLTERIAEARDRDWLAEAEELWVCFDAAQVKLGQMERQLERQNGQALLGMPAQRAQ